jgi:hypothetical protein
VSLSRPQTRFSYTNTSKQNRQDKVTRQSRKNTNIFISVNNFIQHCFPPPPCGYLNLGRSLALGIELQDVLAVGFVGFHLRNENEFETLFETLFLSKRRGNKTNKQTNWQTDKQTNWQTDKQTNWQTDKQTNKQANRQDGRQNPNIPTNLPEPMRVSPSPCWRIERSHAPSVLIRNIISQEEELGKEGKSKEIKNNIFSIAYLINFPTDVQIHEARLANLNS